MNLDDLAPKAAQAEAFLKSFANRHRLMILCELQGAERSVTSLQEAIGLSQSSLSQHLARLREDELVKTRREAQTIYYSLANPDVTRMIRLLYEMYCKGGASKPAGGKPAKAAGAKTLAKPPRATKAKAGLSASAASRRRAT
jgi:DNA-binding transcriptional ArsR family regulator